MWPYTDEEWEMMARSLIENNQNLNLEMLTDEIEAA